MICVLFFFFHMFSKHVFEMFLEDIFEHIFGKYFLEIFLDIFFSK